MRSIIVSSFHFTRRTNRIICAVYIFQLLLSLTISLQVYHIIEHSLANSVSLENMISGFNYTIIVDLINNHGASISPMIGQVRWHILFYLFCSVFINGGLLYLSEKNEDSFASFFMGGTNYFISFLKLGILTTVLFILFSSLLWIPFLVNFLSNIEKMDRESPVIWAIPIILIIYLTGLGIIYLVSVYARVLIIRNGTSIWNSFWSSTKIVLNRLRSYMKPIIFLFGIFILITGVHLLAGIYIGITSVALIMFFILLQQVIAFLKIGLRVFSYKLLGAYFDQEENNQ